MDISENMVRPLQYVSIMITLPSSFFFSFLYSMLRERAVLKLLFAGSHFISFGFCLVLGVWFGGDVSQKVPGLFLLLVYKL